ncbi:MAG: metal ABC transporter permease [Hyphomicrobiaceae bacterium]
MSLTTFLQLDLPAMLAALFATLSCALLGNFLVLRRQSLMGDAVSHAVLPGIVLAFLVVGSRATWPVFVGATAAALIAVALIELVRRYGRMDQGTAMGVVFSIMFALGVVLIEQAATRNVDLDAECVLYGQLEDVLWLAPTSLSSLADWSVWAQMPREVTTLFGALVVTSLAVAAFWKELKLASFDPALASALGFRAGIIDLGLMVLVGVVAVAAFEAVGSILVIAMFICPAATARLLTDRLSHQVALSLVFAAVAAIGGYVLAAFGPIWVGLASAVAASGMIAVTSGLILATAVVFAPRHGLLKRRRVARSATADPAHSAA